jgi:signal transduction histidine kinase
MLDNERYKAAGVERQGGRLSFTSVEGEGGVFSFSLPLTPAEPESTL